ncbi:piwi-like protein Siwi [Neocloeon triangulifer]|uniref:piwi-like protein Siwi n=1 Tax=Neocloeon triangulifer TaxID=2078957 RepID=UPI00286EB8E7|nr:piwi-like protein Siwi [Neocloeon triangulifer]
MLHGQGRFPYDCRTTNATWGIANTISSTCDQIPARPAPVVTNNLLQTTAYLPWLPGAPGIGFHHQTHPYFHQQPHNGIPPLMSVQHIRTSNVLPPASISIGWGNNTMICMPQQPNNPPPMIRPPLVHEALVSNGVVDEQQDLSLSPENSSGSNSVTGANWKNDLSKSVFTYPIDEDCTLIARCCLEPILKEEEDESKIAPEPVVQPATAEIVSDEVSALPKFHITRPARITDKRGNIGEILKLHANFYLLLEVASLPIFKYVAKTTPHFDAGDNTFKAVLQGCADVLGNFVLEGNVLYCTKKLSGNACKMFSVHKDKSYFVNLVRVDEVGEQERVDLLNHLMKKILRAFGFFQAGRAFFKKDINSLKQKSDRLDGWSTKPGYLPKVLSCDGGTFFNVDLVHMAIKPDTALDLLQHFQTNRKNWNAVFKDVIVGQHVVTAYNGRVYKITGVNSKYSPLTEFLYKDSKITFIRYYEMEFGIQIKNTKQPLLVSNIRSADFPTSEVYLVPELCRLTGITTEQRRDFFLVRGLQDEVTSYPQVLKHKIDDFIKSLIETKNEKAKHIMSEWKLNLSSEMASLEGRHLPLEVARVGHSSVNKNLNTVKNLFDWTEDWRTYKMLSCVPIKKWVVVVPSSVVKPLERFISLLQSTSTNLGIEVAKPFVIQIESDESNCFLRELKKLFAKEKPQLVLCILIKNREDKYRAIKKLCSVDHGVPSQIVTKKSMDVKYDLPITKRLVVQMNCKVGGTPWSVQVPLRMAMIVGIDIGVDCHNKNVTFGSVVASYNCDFSKYFSSTFTVASKDWEELSRLVCEHIAKAVHYFKMHHKKLPSVVIVYRDGVPNKLLPHVFTREVPLMKKWLNEIYKNDQWHLSYIVVNKHCNAKVFGKKNTHLQTGTVVDSCITQPERYDFFLLSGLNHTRKVSSFTYYNVLFDNTCLSPDRLQRLTYKMTHLYFNIKGTVRVPAPLRYATRLVYIVSNTLHQTPHPRLGHLLHFL